MSSRGRSAFAAAVNAAYYTPITANAPPENAIFSMPFELRQNLHVPIECPDMRTLARKKPAAYRLVMAMLNLCAHANGARSAKQGFVRTVVRLEVTPSRERNGRHTAVGYRYWVYVVDDSLGAPSAMEIGEDTGADLMNEQARAEQEELARDLGNLDMGDANDDAVAPPPPTVSSTRRALEGQVPLERAFINQVMEGSMLRNTWLNADIEAAKKKKASARKGASIVPAGGVDPNVVLDDTLTYHLNGEKSFYQSVIGPYLDEERHAMWIGGHSTEFLDAIASETEPGDPDEAHEARWMRLGERIRENAYYNPLRRNRGAETSTGGFKSFLDTRMPWHYFSLTQVMFQFAENLDPACRDIRQYATYPRDLGVDETGEPITLSDMLDMLPRRRQLAFLEGLDFCDTFHDKYPYPNLVFELAPEALFPEVYLEAGFPLLMGRPIPAEYFAANPLEEYAECIRSPISTHLPYANAKELQEHEDGLDEASLKRMIVRRMVHDARGRLVALQDKMSSSLAFNVRAPQKPSYPLTKKKMAEHMLTRKAQYLQARGGGGACMISSALHHEWTRMQENTFLTVASAALTVPDTDRRIAREMRRVMLDTGGGDDSGIAVGMIPDAVLFGTEDTMSDEIAEQLKDATKEMDPEVAVRDMCVFRRLAHDNRHIHPDTREKHLPGLDALNAPLIQAQLDAGKEEADECDRIDLDDYVPYRQECLLATAQLGRQCYRELSTNKDVSAGVDPLRKWYQGLSPDDRILPIADTRVAARPGTMYRTAMYTYLNDILAVSSLYVPLLTAYYASLDAVVYTDVSDEATLNMGMAGAAFGGKSFVLSAVEGMRVPGTVLNAAHTTDQTFNVQANMDDLVLIYHEMPDRLFIVNAKGENSDSVNMFKARITSRITRVAYFRYDEETGKRTYGVTIAPCSGVVMFASNSDLSMADEALKSRFFIYGVGHRKDKLFGTEIQERELHDEMVNRMERNQYTHIQRLLHYYTVVTEKFIQAGVFRESPATTFISDKLVNLIFENLQEQEGIKRPDRRAYRRVCRLARVLHVSYAVWITHATPFYLYAYPSRESVRWSQEQGGKTYHYVDDDVELSEAEVEACIARNQPPQWTSDVIVYLLAPFLGVQKESVMEAFCLLRSEFMSLDSDHVLRFLAYVTGFGVKPAGELPFFAAERRARHATGQAPPPADGAAAIAADDGYTLDANYLDIETENMNLFFKRIAESFVSVRPSDVQVKMVLHSLINTMHPVSDLEYDRATQTITVLDTLTSRPIVKMVDGRNGKLRSLAISTGYLMSLFKRSASEVNEGGMDRDDILPRHATIGNPLNDSGALHNRKTWERGAWKPPAPLNVTNIGSLTDAQNYAVVRYDDALMRVLARTVEGPALERSPLPVFVESIFHQALASKEGANPVFDYGISHSPPPYKIHTLARHVTGQKDQRKITRVPGEVTVERPEDLNRDISVVSTAGICGILRLRRLPVREGGNVIKFLQHTQIHEATRRFFPINHKRSRENSVAQRMLEAPALVFQDLDVDYVVAARSAKVIGSPPLPLRLRLRDNDHYALECLDRQPCAFAPFTMVYLSVFNELEIDRKQLKRDDGERDTSLELMPALSLAEDINRRIKMCGPAEPDAKYRSSAARIMLNRFSTVGPQLEAQAKRTALEQIQGHLKPAQLAWFLRRPGALAALPQTTRDELQRFHAAPSGRPLMPSEKARMALALVENPAEAQQHRYATQFHAAFERSAVAQPLAKRTRRALTLEVPGMRRNARPSLQQLAGQDAMDIDEEPEAPQTLVSQHMTFRPKAQRLTRPRLSLPPDSYDSVPSTDDMDI